MSDKTVNAEADELIHGERAKNYGHPKINFVRIAMAWNGYLHERATTADGKPEPLRPHDVCQMMILLKSVRTADGYHRDSAVDAIGYAALDAILAEDDEY